MDLYPINLNIQGKKCVVIGGGNVARRKVVSLLNSGAIIIVISPMLHPDLLDFGKKKQITVKERNYQKGDLNGALLCFAATSRRDVQKEIETEAKERGVLVNSIDDPAACDFQIPSQIRRGQMLITASTGGASPALSKQIRVEIEKYYGTEYGSYVYLLGEIRKQVVTASSNQSENQQLFLRLLESDLLSHIQQSNWTEVEKILQLLLPPQIDSSKLIADLQIYRVVK